MKTPLPQVLTATFGTAGLLETGYLTFSKLTSTPVSQSICDIAGSHNCIDVLNSAYSTLPVLNIPLVSLALAGYAAVTFLSATDSTKTHDQSSIKESNARGNIILAISSAMATFSGYLMIVLSQVLHESCAYCYLSAFLSTAMTLSAWASYTGTI